MPSSTPALLERERELSELERLAATAAEGRGVAVVVLGPAGIGKTSLLEAARRRACRHGLTVLAARGGELERDFPYGVVRNLLEPTLHGLDAHDRQAVLGGAARLAAPLLGQAPADVAEGTDSPFALVHALYWVCANLAARGPLMIVVDDLQWVDAPSVRFLAYLLPRIDELAVVVLIATRPPGEHDACALVRAITAARDVRAVRPAPLSEAGVAELLNAAVGRAIEPSLARAGWQATGGNPFLCEALASTVAKHDLAARPAELAEIAGGDASALIVARLGRLPEHAHALARAVAILGSDAQLRHAAALAELADREAAAAADTLAAQGIFAAGQPLEFVHPLVRAAVRQEIPPAQRRLAHARAARIVHDSTSAPDAVAAHLLAADPASDPWAAQQLVAAAATAMQRGAADAAATYLRRALREPPPHCDRGEILRALGEAELMIGQLDDAAAHLEEARAVAEDPRWRAGVARELASVLSVAGRYDAAVAALDCALIELGGADDELVLALEGQRFLHAAMAPRDPSAPTPCLARAAVDPIGSTRGERAYLAALTVNALLFLERPEGIREWGRRLVAGGIAADLTRSGALWHPVAYALTFSDEFGLVEQMVSEGLEEAGRRGSAVGAARAYQSRAALRLRQGQLREAVADARVAIDAGSEVGLVGHVVAVAVLVEALVESGELEEAATALAESELDGEIALHFLTSFVLHARARLRLGQGRHADALADLEELDRRGACWQPWNPAVFPYRSSLALALLATRNDRRSRALATVDVDLARRFGAARAVGIALRTLGLVERGATGVTLLRESVDVLASSGATLEQARSLVELGAAIRRSGTPAAARDALRAGMELAHRCGARPLVERARAELVITGARPRRIMRAGVDALTPSELRVARLASAGNSNRAIAQTLFVTLRTVEVHLTHTYQKLDIAGREQLPAALAAGDLTP